MRVAVVKALHDDEACVWYVERSDVEGKTFEAFCNVATAVGDLHEGEGGEVQIGCDTLLLGF
jgi:hypothetical protein